MLLEKTKTFKVLLTSEIPYDEFVYSDEIQYLSHNMDHLYDIMDPDRDPILSWVFEKYPELENEDYIYIRTDREPTTGIMGWDVLNYDVDGDEVSRRRAKRCATREEAIEYVAERYKSFRETYNVEPSHPEELFHIRAYRDGIYVDDNGYDPNFIDEEEEEGI